MKSVIPGWATNYVPHWPSGMQMNNRNSVPENPFQNVQTGVDNGRFTLWGIEACCILSDWLRDEEE